MNYRKSNKEISFWLFAAVIAIVTLSCQAVTGFPEEIQTLQPTVKPTFTPLPPIPVKPGEQNPDEPVFISGNIPYTSPFFLDSISEPFVLLEDQAGFINRNKEFTFSLAGQTIGPVEVHEDLTLSYFLTLPAIPQGTLLDVDNDGETDTGVQIFAIAYWSNTWGDPFLEERDGKGWSNAYVSTITDPDQDDEIIGGVIIAWAPDDHQSFPIGFGADGKLFTEDDPTEPIPAGYNLVNLDDEPFFIYKDSRPVLDLNEGVIAVNDYSDMDYSDAFDTLFKKVSQEYPFTKEKFIDWQALYEEFSPRVARARNESDFYQALRDFTWEIPDGHVGLSFDPQAFYELHGGGFGIVLTELSDGKVIASQLVPDLPAEEAGIQVGAELLSWGGKPIADALGEVRPYFGPYSTEHHKRLEQVAFLPHVPPDSRIQVEFRNPGQDNLEEKTLASEPEYASLFMALPYLTEEELSFPVSGEVIPETDIAYIRISTFSDDYHFMAYLWDRLINEIISAENQISGLILDMRENSGGSSGLAFDFSGYFFDEEFPLFQSLYFNDLTGEFEMRDHPARITPAPAYYDGPIAVLVSPYCISACEAYAYALQQDGRSIIVGHHPTAGAFGEVGRGQYRLPDDLNMQFPTGRSETLDGELLLEGVGVIPDIFVPVTLESALGQTDAVLEAAIQAINDQ